VSGVAVTSSPPRPPLGRLIAVEARKMVDTRAGLWLLILTLLGAVAGALGQSLGGSGADAEAGRVFYSAIGGTSVLLPIVGILLVTSEWSQRTGLVTFALVPSRHRIVAAKFVAAIGVTILFAAVALALALLCGSLLGTGSEIDGGEVVHGILYLLISVGIGVAIGLPLQSSPLAIVTLFAGPIAFGAAGAISDAINDVTSWLDQSSLTDLIDATASVDWDKIAVTAVFWIALPLAAGLVRLARGDID
jgi:hypothetical protein